MARAVWAVMKSNDDVRSSARNIFIDRLANARLELGQIARQIDYDVALLSIHRIEFDAKLCSVVMDLGAAVTSHASHNRSASRKSREITNRNKRRNLYCFLSYESAPAAKRGGCARAISALAADGASCCDCRGRWVGLSASASCRLCLGRSAARNRQSVATNLFRLTGDLVRRKNRGLFPGHEHGFLDRVPSFREQGGGLPRRQDSSANSGCVTCLAGFAAAESPGSVARGTHLWNSSCARRVGCLDLRTEKSPVDVLCFIVDLLFLRDRRKAFARRSYRVRRFPGFLPAGAALKDAGGVFACGVIALRMVALRECNKREPPP